MAGKKYLLDTHCLIWFQENNAQIPGRVIDKIQDADNTVLFSQISLFELAIKKALGKLPAFIGAIEDVFGRALFDGFAFLPINNNHLFAYGNVLMVDTHKDPFDRLLIATAMVEDATILSVDKNFKLYDSIVTVEW